MIKRASLACLIIGAQLLLPLATVRSQQPQPTPTQQPQTPPTAVASTDGDDEVVRITTNLVQIDAVVTDLLAQGRNRVVTQWGDFEIIK